MPAVAIAHNRLRFPKGYRLYPLRPTGYQYPLHGPGIVRLGAFQSFVIASVPADLSTFIVNAPNGAQFTFQFVYNASVQTQGIKVPLPASGASTAAQVTTQLLNALAAGSGTPLGGQSVNYPFLATQTAATHLDIDYTVNGNPGAPGGTQATITNTTTGPSVSSTAVVPARIGKFAELMPGF